MLYKIDFETDTAEGWVEGDFGDEHQASEVGDLVTRLSNLCRLYENEYFKLMMPSVQQWLESESVQMRILVLGPIIEARFYAEQALIRSSLELSRGFLRLRLMRLARELGNEDATSFKVLVFEDETRFRTVNFGELVHERPEQA